MQIILVNNVFINFLMNGGIMSQSNNIPESDNILFEVGNTDANSELQLKFNREPLTGFMGKSQTPEMELLMSEEDFLDLIPVNCYFH